MPYEPAYCDLIADRIKNEIDLRSIGDWHTGPVEMDLHPTGGYMLSTKKTLTITDHNGKMYKVTVEEV